MKELERQFEVLLDELSTSLTMNDVEQIRELARANELGIAVENFCTQLYERQAVCTKEQVIRIAEIGKAIGINSSFWNILGNE